MDNKISLYISKLKHNCIRIGLKGYINQEQYGMTCDLPTTKLKEMIDGIENLQVDENLLQEPRCSFDNNR